MLARHGYSVYIQAWHCLPGDDFVEWMNNASKNSANFIAICSCAYFNHPTQYAKEELKIAYRLKNHGEIKLLLPIVIEEISNDLIPPIFGGIVRLNFFDKEQKEAELELLRSIHYHGIYYKASPFPNSKTELASHRNFSQSYVAENICLLGKSYLEHKDTELEYAQTIDIARRCFAIGFASKFIGSLCSAIERILTKRIPPLVSTKGAPGLGS